MNKTLLLLTFLTLSFLGLAQAPAKGGLTATLLNDQKAPVENATAELLRAADSILVKTALSDRTGTVSFEHIAFGRYRLRLTSVGLAPYLSDPFTLSEEQPLVTLPSITLTAQAAGQLQGVTVVARKPFIQKLSDRIVVNVENSIVSAGSSALDILERSPGVTVDQNDVIGLRGRQGVTIFIDGKPTPMSGADLANYLRGLPAGAIERIDIITNPSAKYDAAGNSGIIDIRMKKDQRLGSNGTLSAGFGQGAYPKANAGTTFNYRNKKVNLFGNYNYSYRKNFGNLILNRNFYEDGVFVGSDDKDNFSTAPFYSNTVRVGADFFAGKKTILGVVVNSSFNRFSRRNQNRSVVNDEYNHPAFRFASLGTNKDRFSNTVANLNGKHTFDSTGRELTADIDYGTFRSSSLTRTATQFFNLDGTSKSVDDILDGDQQGRLHFTTAKADYVHPFTGGKWEAGFKTSFVSSDNDAQFWNVFTSGSVVDAGKTNRFYYKENNNAAYANFSRTYKKFDFQLGLRAEQTNVDTRQVKGDVRWDSGYLQWFPSAFFNYKPKEETTF
ncbi:MAG TPA: outer membrane beta-barrel protein, partial [Chitinophagaceae bacterium]|nr:outer membrane beta-barrel protein [Chitinophagaceae bacterium]